MINTSVTRPAVLADILRVPSPETIALEYQGRAWSYGHLANASERIAAALAARGIRSGDRVAIWLPNSGDWFVAAFGCYRLGAAYVSINLRLTGREVGELLVRTRAAVLFCIDGAENEIDLRQMKALRLIVNTGDGELSAGENGVQSAGLDWLDGKKKVRYDGTDGRLRRAT
ncbi:fatty acid--CoA ligase [Pandoraea terrae]|uniref:Fatty acid--CoA ligase n=1 Tax=Pandoraea terrae TaxID=1537710 RepID=A0A5E4UU54_9BURK|nr:AMP-binding protein [Pandoraea terrae]VVE03511.1 fatty acid--CoA ligase [Pandoraea terrae]